VCVDELLRNVASHLFAPRTGDPVDQAPQPSACRRTTRSKPAATGTDPSRRCPSWTPARTPHSRG
jgi:hypothetical protein